MIGVTFPAIWNKNLAHWTPLLTPATSRPIGMATGVERPLSLVKKAMICPVFAYYEVVVAIVAAVAVDVVNWVAKGQRVTQKFFDDTTVGKNILVVTFRP